ncbi:unnamed protein product [Colias eurytheme]|nr:unnamed protein product [Colias eurytheme]
MVIMWNLLAFVVAVSFYPYSVDGSLADQLSETTQLCCNQGTMYARNHTSEDCSSSIPPDVPSAFGTLCIFAMDQCCKEYFQKKKDCEIGVDLATTTNSCASTQDSTKKCCLQCMGGTSIGKARGGSACNLPISGKSAEQLLAADAYSQCCKNSAKQDSAPRPTAPRPVFKDEEVYSVCEEYAPNELCAHHCIPIPGSYKCECNPGFMLMSDGKNCKEVTKNRCKPHNPCQHKCNDNGIEVKCSCRRGYQLMQDGKSCEDIDECTLDPPVCLPNTQCHNILGSYKCIPLKHSKNQDKGQCPSGFTRNLANNACDDINECKLPNPPCPPYLCTNTIGGYACGGTPGDPANLPRREERCPPGFRAGREEECDDVDECAMNKDDCNKISQFCINTRGSFHCQDKGSQHCPPGFKSNRSTNKCEDIDECEENEDICKPNEICVNVPGEYDCKPKHSKAAKSSCPDGMRENPDTKVCEDIDECAEGTHLCDQYQNCLNTNASHECICKEGFELDHTTGACVDINECATDQNTCIPESQRCDNTVGSYLCIRFISCGTGYILHHSTSTCEDIDECAIGTHNCARAGPEYHCVNIPGSFRCQKTHPTTPPPRPQPEYEYEYYDTDDEIEGAKNNTEAETTTTPQPEPTTITVSSSTTSTTPEPPKTEKEPEIDNNIDVNEPKKEEPIDAPQPTEVTKTEPKEADRDIYHFDPENEPKKPEIPEEPEYPVTYPDIKPTEKHDVTESTQPTPTSPKMVYVDVGEGTAIVKGDKKDDGSVEVNTKDLPKNEWTVIHGKPTDCQPGFELDEYGACFDIDECATNRHTCSGLTETCRNTMGGYLSPTSSTSTTTSTVAPPTSSTRNYFWGYPDYRPVKTRPFIPMTTCDAGYRYNVRLGTCEDVDECTTGKANCAVGEVCVNTLGGYRCECAPHWRLDARRQRCVPRTAGGFPQGYGNQPEYSPVDPQDIIPNTHHQIPEPDITSFDHGGPASSCPWGTKLGDDNTCQDIDECATGEAKCGPLQLCTNLPGGYTCSCPKGHRLIGDHECEDVDECALGGSVPICSQNADCVNTVGSYQCRCHEGFRTAPVNDKVCVDVDECVEARAGELCEQRCNNVWGAYRCSCHRGYRLQPDNRTCADVDECTEFKSKNLCVGRCVNEPGSYRCSCPSGYRLSEDKRSCIDIDECETGIAPCAKGAQYEGVSDVCLNTRGAFRCHRITCPPGYRLESRHRCTKIQTYCPPADWECAHQPSTYSYNFITFVSMLDIRDSKVDLFTMRGPNWPYAKMNFKLRLIDVNAPPSVAEKADINAFLLVQTGNQAVMSLTRGLVGPQSVELELSMELFSRGQFGGIAVAKLYIHVSEYEF